MMKIDWEIRTRPDDAAAARMQAAAEAALQAEGIRLPCSVHVCLCDDPAIAQINRDYRGIDASTDVLSFPSISWPAGQTAGRCERKLRQEYDDETGACFLGDIFISVPHMVSQAEEYGHSVTREGCYLLVHGLCHLMGYDHIEERDRAKMREIEEKILSSLGLARDREDPVPDAELVRLARETAQAAYCPYSGYPVGAALRSADGRIFTGCNVENASYGLTMCAERVALFKAVREKATAFDVIAVASQNAPWPCGACRQALREFAPDLRVLVSSGDRMEERSLRDLLPDGFGPENLGA